MSRPKKWKHPDWRVRWRQRLRPKWRVADALNRSQDWCWADLVDWCLETRKERRQNLTWYRKNGWGRLEAWRDRRGHRLRDRTGYRCQVESSMHRDRMCYCGKFRNGALYDPAKEVIE